MKVTKTVDKGGIIRYKNEKGELHSEDGPAIIYPRGTFVWYNEGKLHREDGPAVIYYDGDVEYWLNDKQYTEEEFELELVKKKLERVKNL